MILQCNGFSSLDDHILLVSFWLCLVFYTTLNPVKVCAGNRAFDKWRSCDKARTQFASLNLWFDTWTLTSNVVHFVQNTKLCKFSGQYQDLLICEVCTYNMSQKIKRFDEALKFTMAPVQWGCSTRQDCYKVSTLRGSNLGIGNFIPAYYWFWQALNQI